ncbi:MAG: carboxypeptidase regulatory-like domain-containing protein [Candidatus Poseidoniales archaeon]|nr:MAG: carboxypeptidase regulatory-like domain-containing protein [Candidatus Poseidoniales archaeon]
MDESEMEERRAALRSRVQSQLEASQAATESRKKAASEELVVHSSELERAVEKATVKFQEKIDELDQSDRSRILTLAASLILIGSIFGMATGALILNGNPDELLNSTLFETTDTVDITGLAVEAVDGNGVENVTIQLLRFGTDEVIAETLTDGYGYFNFQQVITQATTLKVISDGYVTVERDFIPEEAGVRPITMTPGNGERYENHIPNSGGWTLESAVGLSTAIGIITVISALIGFQAAFEVRRAKHYRRTQYLAGLSLFSRGLIVFGPLLILTGMILLVIAKQQFSDVGDD